MNNNQELISQLKAAKKPLEEIRRIEQEQQSLTLAYGADMEEAWTGFLWGANGIVTWIKYDIVPEIAVYILAALFHFPQSLLYILMFIVAGSTLYLTSLTAKKKNQELEDHKAQLLKRYTIADLKIEEIRKSNMDVLNVVPAKYQAYSIVTTLIEVLENRRADGLKEALNLYEELAHRQRVEAQQEAILREQMHQSEIAQQALNEAYRTRVAAEQAAADAAYAASMIR